MFPCSCGSPSTTAELLRREKDIVSMLLQNIPYSSEIRQSDYLFLFKESQRIASENEALKTQNNRLLSQLYEKDEMIRNLRENQQVQYQRAAAKYMEMADQHKRQTDQKLGALQDRLKFLEERERLRQVRPKLEEDQQSLVTIKKEDYTVIQNLLQKQREKISSLEAQLDKEQQIRKTTQLQANVSANRIQRQLDQYCDQEVRQSNNTAQVLQKVLLQLQQANQQERSVQKQLEISQITGEDSAAHREQAKAPGDTRSSDAETEQ